MNTPAVDPDLLDFAITLTDRAGRLAADLFFGDPVLTTKPDGSAVTDADHAVENLIRAQLRQQFADDAIYGEEAGSTPGTSSRTWVIDPIDGTSYFANRIPLFSTRLACYDEHGPAIAVINEPIARRTIFAGRGLGCRIRTGAAEATPTIRHTADLAAARVEMVNPSRWAGDLLMTLHRHVTVTGHLGGITGLLTGLVDAIVIGGTEQGYEDLAPLPVIVEESGCAITDLDGGPLLSGPGSALISTRRLHAPLLELIRPTLAARRAAQSGES
jgi:histidinol-phosphatase